MFDIEHGSTVDRAELVGMIERLTTVTVRAGYGAPIAEVVRDWIGAHGAEDLDRRLSALEDAGRAR